MKSRTVSKVNVIQKYDRGPRGSAYCSMYLCIYLFTLVIGIICIFTLCNNGYILIIMSILFKEMLCFYLM